MKREAPNWLNLGDVDPNTTDEELEAHRAKALDGNDEPASNPAIIPANPDNQPKPERTTDDPTFMVEEMEPFLYDFCANGESWWEAMVTPVTLRGTGPARRATAAPRSSTSRRIESLMARTTRSSHVRPRLDAAGEAGLLLEATANCPVRLPDRHYL